VSVDRQRLHSGLSYKRIDAGGFTWPRMIDPGGTITLTPAQLAMLIEGIDWRSPEKTWRPAKAG
jgi:transposase